MNVVLKGVNKHPSTFYVVSTMLFLHEGGLFFSLNILDWYLCPFDALIFVPLLYIHHELTKLYKFVQKLHEFHVMVNINDICTYSIS